jgi:hypothetical protein
MAQAARDLAEVTYKRYYQNLFKGKVISVPIGRYRPALERKPRKRLDPRESPALQWMCFAPVVRFWVPLSRNFFSKKEITFAERLLAILH